MAELPERGFLVMRTQVKVISMTKKGNCGNLSDRSIVLPVKVHDQKSVLHGKKTISYRNMLVLFAFPQISSSSGSKYF